MRNYKSKNVHTKPSKSGVKNMPKEFEEKHKDGEEDNVLESLTEMFVDTVKRPRKSAWTKEDLAREIEGYFNYCIEKTLKPCKAGIRTYLGVSRSQYHAWQSEPQKYGEISDIINLANDVMEQEYINKSQKYPTANIFLLKTSHGHVETSKVDITSNAPATSTEVQDAISRLGLDKE